MKEKKSYRCSECGYTAAKWSGKCPSCGKFNTLAEDMPRREAPKAGAVPLYSVEAADGGRITTSIPEFDRVMGGGIVRDSVTILTSPPGGGKSTLSLIVAADLAARGLRVLYASGEESVSQIKSRAERILASVGENIWVLSDTSLDRVMDEITGIDPDLIVIDSIQTFYLTEYLPARAGNPIQTMECASRLLQAAKDPARPRAVILIGQMNKNDELAGLRALEHLVDTVLYLEGGAGDELRSVISTKNRFGSAGEMGFFSMTEKGLVSIDNPSEYFITRRTGENAVSGAALTVIREGMRPIIVEIESLVSESFTPYPVRICDTLRREQLNTLISIMEQRAGINLYNKNVVLKSTGGIKLREQSVNLSAIISIASSVFDMPVPADSAFISDVGLTGELKKVPSMEARVRELARMGFKRVYVAEDAMKGDLEGIEISRHKTVNSVIREVFGNT